MLDGELLRGELARLEEKRRGRAREAEERAREFHARHPEAEAALRAMKTACVAAARKAAGGEPDFSGARIAEREYRAALEAALAAEGLPADALEPRFDCPGCRDTGFSGDIRKSLCGCVIAPVLSRMSQAARLRPECRFENCDLTVFPDNAPVNGKPFDQRGQMAALYEYCGHWADAFPDNKKINMLIHGGVGLGKTFLLHAIANRLIERKQTPVLSTTAYHIVSEARNGFDALGNIELYLSAPVLVIDDLGAEPLIPGVTAETLFTVLNERCSAGRHTLTATNYSLGELGKRYGERLLSRLTRRETTFVTVLKGRDVRV